MPRGNVSFSARARQAWTIARIELRRAFFAKRGLWVYALALLPALIFFGHGLDAKWRIERLSRRGLTDPALMNSVQKGETLEAVKARLGTAGRRTRRDASQACSERRRRQRNDDARDRARRRCAFRPPEHQPPDLQRRRRSPGFTSSRSTVPMGGRISRSAVPRREARPAVPIEDRRRP